MKTSVFTITQIVTIDTYEVEVLDTSVDNLWLRRYNEDGEYQEEIEGVNVGGASFAFDHSEGNYQMWKSAHPDVTAANRVDKFHGGADKYRYLVDETLPYLRIDADTNFHAETKRIKSVGNAAENNDAMNRTTSDSRYLQQSGGTLSGALNMNGQPVNNLPAPVGPLNPLRLTDGTERYLDKRAGVTNQVYSGIIFRGNISSFVEPLSLSQLVNRGFVESFCQSILTGVMPSAYQQSGNLIRILYSGTQENNKVYKTLEAGIDIANGFAAVDREMVCVIEGRGAGAELTNYNLLPVTYNSFVHIHSAVPNNLIRVSEDIYEATNLGEKIISNCIIAVDGVDGEMTFEKYIFIDCEFVKTPSSGTPTYTLTNCIMINCRQDDSIVNPDSDCIGSIFNKTTKVWRYFGGMQIGDASISDEGDIQARRFLGRKGASIASASTITLGEGNFFPITGTATIHTINASGWTEGSPLFLHFAGACLIDIGPGNILNAAGDFTTVPGNIYIFIMDNGKWIRAI